MKHALVIGASGGIGSALANALKIRGCQVTGLSRSQHGLDLSDAASVEQHLGAIQGPFDLIFVASGVLDGAGHPPEKTLKLLQGEAMAAQFAVNCIGPALILKQALRLLPRSRPSLFAALSARVGSIGDNHLGGWISYRTAKAALNQVIHTGAIELARTHPKAICVSLHPGTVATSFTADYAARHEVVAPHVAAENLLSVTDRLTPKDSGGFFDWRGDPVPW